MYSAEFFPDDDEAEEKKDSRLETWLDKHFGNEKMTSFIITVSMVFGIVFSVALFILLPTALGGLLSRLIPGIPIWGRNLAEGIIRIIVFLLYLALCSKMHDIHRTFEYHGAEHKTIFCYEAGLPLTVENVRKQSKHHPRCGTSFLFVVVIVSILLSSVLFSFIHVENTLSRMGLHLLLLPLIVSVTYEINRFVGGHDNLFCRIIRAPGLWIQRFTTFEPDDSMIEVGIRALEEVIPEGKGKDAW